MIKQYLIKNELTGVSYEASMETIGRDGEKLYKTEAAIDQWFERKIRTHSFGKPERNILYKMDTFEKVEGSEDNWIMENPEIMFPFDGALSDRVIDSSQKEEVKGNQKTVKYYYKIKADYVVEINDLEAELEAKKQEEAQLEATKKECCERLANIDWSEKTTIASLKPILKDLIMHLGIE